MAVQKAKAKSTRKQTAERIHAYRSPAKSMGMMGVPTVAIMKPSEMKEWLKPNQRIVYEGQANNPQCVRKALTLAHAISQTGKIKLKTDNASLVQLKKMGKRGLMTPNMNYVRKLRRMRKLILLNYGQPGSKGFKTFAFDTDGRGADEPKVYVTFEFPLSWLLQQCQQQTADGNDDKGKKNRGGGDDGNPPGGNVFLKAPLRDEQIIEALELAIDRLLNRRHTAYVERSDNTDGSKKRYNEFHLLVCLYFFIHIKGLYASSDFYSNQRATFHHYCEEQFGIDFDFKSRRYFSDIINTLDLKGYGFEGYIEEEGKPTVKRQTGEQDLIFWYEIYKKAAVSYTKILINEV